MAYVIDHFGNIGVNDTFLLYPSSVHGNRTTGAEPKITAGWTEFQLPTGQNLVAISLEGQGLSVATVNSEGKGPLPYGANWSVYLLNTLWPRDGVGYVAAEVILPFDNKSVWNMERTLVWNSGIERFFSWITQVKPTVAWGLTQQWEGQALRRPAEAALRYCRGAEMGSIPLEARRPDHILNVATAVAGIHERGYVNYVNPAMYGQY